MREIDPNKLQTVADRVIVKPDAKSDKTESGVLLPSGQQQKNTIMTGEVIAVGNGRPGEKMIVKKGDIVMFPEHSGTEISGGLLIMQEVQILSII